MSNPNSETTRPHGRAMVGVQLAVSNWHLPLLAVLLLTPRLLVAQHAVNWSTIDGGGGMSTGGVYTVTGTIGQLDAGTLSGGDYTRQGGFWGIIAAVQTPGAPYLSVLWTATNTVCVWWPWSDTSWQLQATPNLVTTGSVWTSYAYVTNEANCVYIESPPLGNKFYRLKR